VVRFYNKRGTAEQWIKEGKQAVKTTRLSCHRFRSNEVRLWLSVIAYNLGNLWRRLVLPKKIENWSLTRLQQRLVRKGEVGEACPLLLVVAGGEPSDQAAVWQYGAADRGAAGGVGLGGLQTKTLAKKGGWTEKVSLESIGRRAGVSFGVPRRGRVGAYRDRQRVPVLTKFAQWIEGERHQECSVFVPRVHNGNPD
jgi:hypothetical protein